MALFDGDHRLVSLSPEAEAWFEDIVFWHAPATRFLDVPLPESVLFTVMDARAMATSAADGEPLPAVRTRVRATDGSWLALHASVLRERDGSLGPTAVVVERAKASEVAPLIVAAYELTPREVEVTRALARGLSTSEIAAELHLSRYTVQDHLKSAYEKTGVSSRGELVAKLYADHYQPGLDAAIGASAARA
jgi:DNA-binding NarL/FixJ family response regulator